MKTTVDLPADLLAEARAVAGRRGLTVRVIFEESLRAFLQREDVSAQSEPFRLEHTIVHGESQPDLTFAHILEVSGINRLSE